MRILIIDDEFTALTKMMTLLTRVGDCAAATNGKQALEMFQTALEEKYPFDLITIDIRLPDTNGVELLGKFNELEVQFQRMPSRKIMVTAKGDSDSVFKAASHHCDAYLVKPVKRDVLMRKLEELGLVRKNF